MSWRIRQQLLGPVLILLMGVAGICTWSGWASAHRAGQQIESQVRNIARTFGESHFPLTERVLEQTKGLSGAEFYLTEPTGRRITTLPSIEAISPPVAAVAMDWQNLRLNERIQVAGQTYLCSGLRLGPAGSDAAGVLYILYPEHLWRDALWDAVRPSIFLGGFVGLSSLVLTFASAQRLSRRIESLERQTRRLATGAFEPVPLDGHEDELRSLGRSINDLAQQLCQLQEAMKQSERLRLLGQVSSGLAHQLRNGVTGATLAIQLHAKECAGTTDRESLDVALRQLALLESNVKRFLDLGRPAMDRTETCLLDKLADEAVALLWPQCRHAHIALDWKPNETPLTVQGDPGRLRHLFLNLLGNAVDAAGPGGAVEIGIRLEVKNGKSLAMIEVWDTGSGPPPEIVGRLFEPFATSKMGGIGLGLMVARQAAESHGGSISWRRDAGRTCFCVALPVNAE